MPKPTGNGARKPANTNKPLAGKPARQNPVAPATATVARTTNAHPAGKPASRVETKASAEPTPQAIAEAAYYLWLQRGGSETINWLEAERMLKRKVAAR